MILALFQIIVASVGALLGMILADYIHEWKTGKRIRDCGERREQK